MNISDVCAILACAFVILTCVYVLIFISHACKGINVTVNIPPPPVLPQPIPQRTDIEAMQKKFDDEREKTKETSQGIDSLLSELNIYMTGGKTDGQL